MVLYFTSADNVGIQFIFIIIFKIIFKINE